MLKRIILLAFIFSAFTLIALSPMYMTAAAETSPKLQATVVVTVVVVAPTPASGSAPAPVYVTGMPNSMMVIVGLLVVLGIVVVIGALVLMSNRRA